MRYLLATFVLSVTFLHCCNLKQLPHSQMIYQQKGIELASEKTEPNTPAAVHTKAACEAAALTLEYFAVQLPRSQQLQ